MVGRQDGAGIDIVSDDEFGKPGFADPTAFPERNAQMGPTSYVMLTRLFCMAPLTLIKAVLGLLRFEGEFLPVPPLINGHHQGFPRSDR